MCGYQCMGKEIIDHMHTWNIILVTKFHTCGPTLLLTGAVCGKFKNESHKWLDQFIDRLDISPNRTLELFLDDHNVAAILINCWSIMLKESIRKSWF